MEATGNCHWLVDLLAELGHEIWIGDAAQIRASYVRKQKTDKRDAAHILKLLVDGRESQRGVWTHSRLRHQKLRLRVLFGCMHDLSILISDLLVHHGVQTE